MILSREFIRLFRKLGLITIEPFNEDQLQANSYDLRVGNWFSRVSWTWEYNEDEGSGEYVPEYEKPWWIRDGRQVAIPNGGTLLGMTKEVIGTRFCAVAMIHSRSTTRREAKSVCLDSGLGDIQYINHYTLEFSGHSCCGDPYLTVGTTVAQAVFYLTTPTLDPYRGQYNESDWPLNMIPKKYRDALR